MLPKLLVGAFCALVLHAETGYDAWLRYAPLEAGALAGARQAVPAVVARLDDSELARTAEVELVRGVRGMLGRTLRAETALPGEDAVVLGTLDEIRRAAPQWRLDAALPADGYWLKTLAAGGRRYTIIAAADARGLLYGSFAWLRGIALGQPLTGLDDRQSPYAPIPG